MHRRIAFAFKSFNFIINYIVAFNNFNLTMHCIVAVILDSLHLAYVIVLVNHIFCLIAYRMVSFDDLIPHCLAFPDIKLALILFFLSILCLSFPSSMVKFPHNQGMGQCFSIYPRITKQACSHGAIMVYVLLTVTVLLAPKYRRLEETQGPAGIELVT